MFTGLGQATEVENRTDDRHSHIVLLVLSAWCLISFLDQHCHHIYCPFKNTCQTPVYLFPLCLGSLSHTFICSCFGNHTCLVLLPLSDIWNCTVWVFFSSTFFFGKNWPHKFSYQHLAKNKASFCIILNYFFLITNLTYGKHPNTIKAFLSFLSSQSKSRQKR